MAPFDSFRVRRILRVLETENVEDVEGVIDEVGLEVDDLAADYLAARQAFQSMLSAGALVAHRASLDPERYRGLDQGAMESEVSRLFHEKLDQITGNETLSRAFDE